jgi:hypothetical protein
MPTTLEIISSHYNLILYILTSIFYVPTRCLRVLLEPPVRPLESTRLRTSSLSFTGSSVERCSCCV